MSRVLADDAGMSNTVQLYRQLVHALTADEAGQTGHAEKDESQRIERTVTFKAENSELQVVYGEVYAPGLPDSQGDVMSEDEIRKAAWSFCARGRVKRIDLQHDNIECGAVVVESFIARAEDPVFTPGAWVLGVHVPDTVLWEKIKSGELNGFSFQALVARKEATIEVVIPDELKGRVEKADGHVHQYRVRFDADGNFMGGETDEVDGHYHRIKGGSVTEKAEATGTQPTDAHTHRFHLMDDLLALQD
jgi:hypothetical protein